VPRSSYAGLLLGVALVLTSARPAYAQRIPEEAVWSLGAALFAPFVAVPLKSIMLRLRGRNAGDARLWSLGAIEWAIWFPLGFVLLKFGRYPSLIAPLLFVSIVWLHRTRVDGASWAWALLLSLPTPAFALALPLLAFVSWGQLAALAR
jgi:hypothetical protein